MIGHWYLMPIILVTWEDDSVRPVHPKSLGYPISTNSWAWWCALVIPVTEGSINKKITVQSSLTKSETLSPK
jgi:hypothetical protein